MKTLTIGSTSIEITSCTRKRDTQRGFFLELVIPKGNITFEELEALFNGCKESIVITEGEDETTYNGFSLLNSVMLKNGAYTLEQCCVSEIEAQLSLAQKKISGQDAIITQLQAENLFLNEELLNTQLALCELYEQSLVESEVQ